jgi:hypothetical protein
MMVTIQTPLSPASRTIRPACSRPATVSKLLNHRKQDGDGDGDGRAMLPGDHAASRDDGEFL